MLPVGGYQELSMFRRHALDGVRVLAACICFCVTASRSFADHADGHVLPPVTVEAPKPQTVVQTKKKSQRSASAARRAKPAASQQSLPRVVIETAGTGPASTGAPPIKQRY